MSLLDALQSGVKVIDLAVPLQNGMSHSASNVPFNMSLTWRHGDRNANGKGGSSSNAVIITGDHVGTHIDAICHVSNNGIMHDNVAVADACRGGKYTRFGAETIEPMICRGVFFDIPKLKGVDVLPAGYGVTDDDLRAALPAGVALRAGDVALVRTGWIRHFYADGEAAAAGTPAAAFLGSATGVPGVAASGAQWLADQGVRAAGADTIQFEQVQLGPTFKQRPCHGILLWQNGIHIIEVLDLERLAAADVAEFMFVLSPLKWVGATASHVRPLAVVNA